MMLLFSFAVCYWFGTCYKYRRYKDTDGRKKIAKMWVK